MVNDLGRASAKIDSLLQEHFYFCLQNESKANIQGKDSPPIHNYTIKHKHSKKHWSTQPNFSVPKGSFNQCKQDLTILWIFPLYSSWAATQTVETRMCEREQCGSVYYYMWTLWTMWKHILQYVNNVNNASVPSFPTPATLSGTTTPDQPACHRPPWLSCFAIIVIMIVIVVIVITVIIITVVNLAIFFVCNMWVIQLIASGKICNSLIEFVSRRIDCWRCVQLDCISDWNWFTMNGAPREKNYHHWQLWATPWNISANNETTLWRLLVEVWFWVRKHRWDVIRRLSLTTWC